jgi:hypothetical protein
VLKDLEFLESCVRSGTCTLGAVILLTNDHTYWNAPASSVPTVDAAFRVHEGARITGRLEWSPEASPGTVEGMEDPIMIEGEYRAAWRNYSAFPEKDAEFRYLLFEVK